MTTQTAQQSMEKVQVEIMQKNGKTAQEFVYFQPDDGVEQKPYNVSRKEFKEWLLTLFGEANPVLEPETEMDEDAQWDISGVDKAGSEMDLSDTDEIDLKQFSKIYVSPKPMAG